MKKVFKILFFALLAYALFTLGKTVSANSINRISMDIFVDSNGNANVTETWNCYSNQSTEIYHPYYNLGNSEITNLSVSMNSTQFETLSSWDTSGSFDEKAYKAGINRVSNGVELCWGISEYGTNTYRVNYTITNFVSNLTDSQMIYWTLIPYDFSDRIGQVFINISSDLYFPSSIDVWGYGNEGGTAYVDNGTITMTSEGSLNRNEYMTILVKLPSGTFNTKNNLNQNFEYYYNLAEEGVNRNGTVESTVISILPFIIFIIIMVFAIVTSKLGSSQEQRLNFENNGNKLPKTKDIPYFRDIPCNKDLFQSFFIGYQFKIVKKRTDLLGSVILKWVRDKKVTLKKDEGKSSKMSIILNEELISSLEDEDEQKLYKMFFEASKDGILEDSEFTKWCNTNYSKILGWFDTIIDKEKDKLVKDGLLLEKPKTLFKSAKYTVTPELRQQALNIAGLKKYLNDYTLISEREAPDVVLFEDYLILAQMFGIADKVAENFKKLYPDLITETNFYSYDNINFVHIYAVHAMTSAHSAHYAAASRYSGGGGGFSVGGGGGGSFGGGGGRRRLPLMESLLQFGFFWVFLGTLLKNIFWVFLGTCFPNIFL